jgi:hypothetical protein
VRALLLSVRLCPAVTGSQRPSVPNTCRRSVLVQRVLDAAFGGGVLALAALGLAPLSRFGAQRRRLPVEPCRGRRLVGAAIGAAWPSGEAYSSSLTRYPARGPTPTRKRWSPPRRRAPRARTKLLCCSSQAAESRSCSICPSATYPPRVCGHTLLPLIRIRIVCQSYLKQIPRARIEPRVILLTFNTTRRKNLDNFIESRP